MRPLQIVAYVAALVVGVALTLAVVTRDANDAQPAEDGAATIATPQPGALSLTPAVDAVPKETPLPPEPLEEATPATLADLSSEEIVALIGQTDDPLMRRALFEKSGLLPRINDVEEAEQLGLLELVRNAETDGAYFEYLRWFAESGAPWAQEVVAGLAASEDERSEIAQAFLLTREEYWAEAAYRRVINEWDGDRRTSAIRAALGARVSWALPMLWETYKSAPASEQVYWVRYGLLDIPRDADHPRTRLFEGALRQGDATTLWAAVDALTNEQRLVHPGGEAWSVNLLLGNFAVLTPQRQVLMLDGLSRVMTERIDNHNSIMVGNVTAMSGLLEAGQASAHAEVRAAADAAVASLGALIDVDATRAQIAEDIVRLDALRARLAQ